MNNRVLVLGASGGIGSALVRALDEAGQASVAIGRNLSALHTLCEGLAHAEPRQITSASFEEIDAVVQEYSSQNANPASGSVTGVVNCCGSLLLKPAHLTSEEDWLSCLENNLSSSFATVRAAGKHLRDASVVLLSSAAVRTGLANHEAIAAAKGGIEALARSAAASYASRNLRFNCVAPGLTDTPMTAKITQNPSALAMSTKLHALGRIGSAEEIASAICWLLNPSQSWITAQIIAVDGGLGSVHPR